MSHCASRPCTTAVQERPRCPVSRARGVAVELQTIKALLRETALTRFEPGAYSFCADSTCPVVYFSESGPTFATTDLRVSVWQKVLSGERTFCYCFGETEAAIRAEIARDGSSRAAERVRAHIQAGRCACEIRNPRGRCCLGELMAAVTRLAASREESTQVDGRPDHA